MATARSSRTRGDIVVTDHPLFAHASTSVPVRRGRGLLIALLVHGLLFIPLLLSVTRYRERPSRSLAAVGVTFVMTPERGVGSPAPARKPPAPEHTSLPERPKPIAPEPPVNVPRLTAAPLPSLTPTVTLDVLRPHMPSVVRDDDRRGNAVAAPPSGAATRAASDGAANGSLPPAIGTPSGTSNWAGVVLGRLEQFKRYPALARARHDEGVCYVRFTIDRAGHVLASSLDRSSGHPALDDEAVALVRRADPLPEPPDEITGETITLTVPVEFFLTR